MYVTVFFSNMLIFISVLLNVFWVSLTVLVVCSLMRYITVLATHRSEALCCLRSHVLIEYGKPKLCRISAYQAKRINIDILLVNEVVVKGRTLLLYFLGYKEVWSYNIWVNSASECHKQCWRMEPEGIYARNYMCWVNWGRTFLLVSLALGFIFLKKTSFFWQKKKKKKGWRERESTFLICLG